MLIRVCRDSLILVVAAALIIPLLGYIEIFQVSEGREGVVVNSILESHDYVLPLRHQEIVPSKPPLFHWLSAAAYRTLNASPEFELRIVSALAALGLLLAVIMFLERTAGGKAAVIGAAILLSTEGYLRMAADGRVDMLCCFLITSAILVWFRSYLEVFAGRYSVQEIPAKVYAEVAVLCGLAVLTKGPIGLLLPGMVFAVLVIIDFGPRSLLVLFRKEWLLTAVISLPWYIAAAIKGRAAFIGRQVIFENFQRFVGGEGISKKPFWFYFEQVWAHAAPWSIVLTVFIILFARDYVLRRKAPELPGALWPQNPTHRLIMKRTAIWALTFFIFFSLSAGKRSAYLLTVLPPLTIFLALAITSGFERLNFFLRAETHPRLVSRIFLGGALSWILCVVLGVGFWAARAYSPDASRLPLSEKLMRSLKAMFDATAGWEHMLEAYFLALLFISGCCWLIAFRRKSFALALCGAFSLFQLLDSVFISTALAGKGRTHGYKQLAADVTAAVGAAEPLTFIKKKKEESFDGFFYYMRRSIRLFEPTGALDGTGVPHEPGLYLARKGWIDEQPNQFTSRVEPLLHGGRRVDAPEREAELFRLTPDGEAPAGEAAPPAASAKPELSESGDTDDSGE